MKPSKEVLVWSFSSRPLAKIKPSDALKCRPSFSFLIFLENLFCFSTFSHTNLSHNLKMRIFFVNLAALIVLVVLQSKAAEIEDVIDDSDLEVCPFRTSIRTRKARVKNDAEETRVLQTSYAGTAAAVPVETNRDGWIAANPQGLFSTNTEASQTEFASFSPSTVASCTPKPPNASRNGKSFAFLMSYNQASPECVFGSTNADATVAKVTMKNLDQLTLQVGLADTYANGYSDLQIDITSVGGWRVIFYRVDFYMDGVVVQSKTPCTILTQTISKSKKNQISDTVSTIKHPPKMTKVLQAQEIIKTKSIEMVSVEPKKGYDGMTTEVPANYAWRLRRLLNYDVTASVPAEASSKKQYKSSKSAKTSSFISMGWYAAYCTVAQAPQPTNQVQNIPMSPPLYAYGPQPTVGVLESPVSPPMLYASVLSPAIGNAVDAQPQPLPTPIDIQPQPALTPVNTKHPINVQPQPTPTAVCTFLCVAGFHCENGECVPDTTSQGDSQGISPAPTLEDYVAQIQSEVKTLIENDPALAAKFLRMAFHDCIGGCDGCIDLANSFSNGLSIPIQALDPVVSKYANAKGISRADIWAIAAMTSANISQKSLSHVDFTFSWIGRRNCEDTNVQCFNANNEAVPCTATQGPHRVLPNASLLTSDLLQYFRNEFGFSANQVVALMGVHSMGKAHRVFSGYDGANGWVKNPGLSNAYYQDLVGGTNGISDSLETKVMSTDWQHVFVNNSDISGMPNRWQWEQSGLMMLDVDMALVRDFQGHFDSATGQARCSHLPISSTTPACPFASATIDFVAKYKNDEIQWLIDFKEVFSAMLVHGYDASATCDGLCVLP